MDVQLDSSDAPRFTAVLQPISINVQLITEYIATMESLAIAYR